MHPLSTAKPDTNASDLNLPRFPVWWTVGGQCVCPKGAECTRPGKHPLTPNGFNDATTDPEQIRAWLERWPRAHWGIATGAASGLVVIDLDTKPDANGVASMGALRERARGLLPPTLTVRTGSGGLHLYFRHPGGVVKCSSGRVGAGIDVRGDGGYVLAPGSGHASGKLYSVIRDLPPAPLPAWLLEELKRTTPAEPLPSASTQRGHFPPASPAVLEAARAALASHGPAVEGHGGDLHTYRAAALLVHDFALTPEESWPLLAEWNATCSPPWAPDDLRAKLRNGGKYGTAPYGCKRRLDALETGRKLITDWSASGSDDPTPLIATVRALRFDDPAKRALVAKELRAATGIGFKDLALPPAVDAAEEAARTERLQAFTARTSPDLIDPTEPLDTARRFLDAGRDREGFPDIVRWQGQFWKVAGSHYSERSDEAIIADLYRFTDGKRNVMTGAAVKSTPALVESEAHALRAAAALDMPTVPAWIGGEAANDIPAGEIIAFPNGLLHVPSRQFLPPTRRFFTLNALGFPYSASAPAPQTWLAFLDQIWGSDLESIETLQEFMGLALTGDTSHQKIFLMVGPKRSGKGTIARVLQALVGEANHASPTLNGLGQHFGLESLISKTLAVISDARLGGRTDQGTVVENLLRISGEDTITVPRKHRTDWNAKLRVRFLILSNEVPALMDQSGALASRFILLRMARTFYGQEDRGLTAKLLGELPGVLHWALAGLERLRSRGYFRQPASALETVRQLETLASPIRAFVEERCEVKPGATVEQARLFQEWCVWCQVQGREQAGTLPIFARNLSSAFPELRLSRPRVSGVQTRTYEGIGMLAA